MKKPRTDAIRGCVRFGYSLSVPSVGLGLEGSAADDSGGAELCSLAPPEVSADPDDGFMASAGFASSAAPDEGGAELCSFAPVDVSAPPDWVAGSAANAGVKAIMSAIPVPISIRVIGLSLECKIGFLGEVGFTEESNKRRCYSFLGARLKPHL
jgi:hypothetical protein